VEIILDEVVAILSRTPRVLDAQLRGLPAAWTSADEGPDTWNAVNVVGHLIDGEDFDWIPRAKIILEHGETRAFEPFDRVAMLEESKGKTIAELLDTFDRLRAGNLRELQALNLTADQLAKRGRHPELGVVTLSQLLSTWIVHDLGHIRQIVRVMSKQYGDAVGPWRAYLSILEE